MEPRQPDERERREWEAEFEAAARRPLRRPAALRLHPHLQAGPRRRHLPLLRHDGAVPRLVREGAAGLAGLWPRGLSTRRPRRSATPSRGTGSATCSSASPGRSSSAIPTRPRTPTCSSRGRSNGSAAVAALRELGFDLTEPQADEIRRGKDFVQLRNGPFDLDLVFAPDGIETFDDAWRRRVRGGGLPGLPSGRHHPQQGSRQPGEGPRVAAAPPGVPRLLAADRGAEPFDSRQAPPRCDVLSASRSRCAMTPWLLLLLAQLRRTPATDAPAPARTR